MTHDETGNLLGQVGMSVWNAVITVGPRRDLIGPSMTELADFYRRKDSAPTATLNRLIRTSLFRRTVSMFWHAFHFPLTVYRSELKFMLVSEANDELSADYAPLFIGQDA